jgi:hypothetical protein
VVIEGNRRIAALKTLKEAHDKGEITLPSEILNGIEEFEALIYQGKNPDIAWIVQGFRHTPGIKSWEKYPQAMFLAKFERESKKEPYEIARIFGMRVKDVTHMIRSYYGFEEARKDEEYGSELSTEKFGHFSEIIFKKDSLQKWLGWNDEKRKFMKKENLRKYLSLAIPEEEEEKPRIDISPLTRDVLSELVKPENKKIFERFEKGELDLEACKTELKEGGKRPVDISDIIRELENSKNTLETLPVPRLQLAKTKIEKEQKEKLLKILKELREILEKQIKNLGVS